MIRISSNQIDSMFGPSHTARYRAGPDIDPGFGIGYGFGGDPQCDPCTFNSRAAVYGFYHFIIPDVQTAHPDWTDDRVRHEAIKLFNLRFSENIASLHQEQRGESSTIVWREEIFTGERTLVIHGGEHDGYTLEKLWGQTAQYDRDEGAALTGSREEYRAQKRIQQALLNGEAASSASLIGHPESVKLIQIFYRGSDGLYYSEQVDLGRLTGRTLTFAEAKAVMAALHHDHEQSAKIADARHDHFMITKGEITASEVKTIAQAVVLTSSETQPTHEQRNHPKGEKQVFSPLETPVLMGTGDLDRVRGDVVTDTSRIIFRDTGEAIKGITVLLHDKEKRKEATDRLLGLSVVQKIRRIFGREDRLVDNQNAAAQKLSMEQKNERLTVEKIREKPVRVGEEIKKRHREMRTNAAALFVAVKTRVALGAVPLLLALLAKEQPKPIRAVEKSIKRHRKKELRRKNYEVRRKAKREAKNPVKVQPLKTERVEPLRTAKERKGRRKRRKVYMRETAVGRIYTVEKKRKRRVRRVIRNAERVLEAKRVPKREKKLWVALAVAAADLATQDTLLRSYERVAGVRFAWVLWMLLARKDTETRKNNFKRSHPASQGETLRSREETPWVLLSIIYYLTALREQAMVNTTPLRQGFAGQANMLSTNGVIFAYAS